MAEEVKTEEVKTEENSLVDELVKGASDLVEEPQTEDNVINDEVILNALKEPSDVVKQHLQELVNTAVKQALAKSTPKKSTVAINPITKEDFNNMSYKERLHIYNTNKALYNKLK